VMWLEFVFLPSPGSGEGPGVRARAGERRDSGLLAKKR
jgi:hypothetical protein